MKTCLEIATNINQWPNCVITDCPNKSCLHLHSNKCWPHTVKVSLNWYRGLHTKERERRSRIIEKEYIDRLITS